MIFRHEFQDDVLRESFELDMPKYPRPQHWLPRKHLPAANAADEQYRELGLRVIPEIPQVLDRVRVQVLRFIDDEKASFGPEGVPEPASQQSKGLIARNASNLVV